MRLQSKRLFSFFIVPMSLITISLLVYYVSHSTSVTDYFRPEKKKILILTSSGGGGHISATEALGHYLGDKYSITKLHVFSELLSHLDIFKIMTLNTYSAENLYNAFIRKKYFRLLTLFYRFGAWYIYQQKNNVRQLIYNYLAETKPDLIISVIPFINYIVLDVAQELNIPFLLIPTDLDLKTYLPYINNPTYSQFYIGLPFSDQEIMPPLDAAKISAEHISIIGAPLRPGFFVKKNKTTLRTYYNIPDNKSIIMIMMGAQGSDDIKAYLHHLLKLSDHMHLMVCIGKNKKIKSDIESIDLPPHISVSIMEFGVDIADLMALSDIIITKSGTLSVYEAIYSNIPMLLDATSAVLPWEQLNHTFINKHQFGESLMQYRTIHFRVSKLLNNKTLLNQYKNNLKNYAKKKTEKEVKKLVKKIINKKSAYQETPDTRF